MKQKPLILSSVLFFTSFSSLIYELVWSRKLSLIFGTNALAVSTVLSVFMAGLALGALFGGKLIEKVKKPYRFLAYLELLIGATCLTTLLLFGAVSHLYLFLLNIFGKTGFFFNIAQFVLSALILIIPTLLIGAVFPIIVKLYYSENKKIGRSVGKCYGADTIGGAVGILFVGFLSVWTIGLFYTSALASLINIVLGISILALFNKQKLEVIQVQEKIKAITDRKVLILFFFSGFAALTLENIWIRFFGLIYGNSIISFSIVVATFLLGLGIGSYLSKFFIKRFKNKVLLFSLIELFIGISSLIILLIFPHLEGAFLSLFFNIDDYDVFIFWLGLISISVLIIPTALMGMTLPVLSTVYVDGKRIGADIGKLFSVNSFGCIVGSFFTGFVFFYFLGLNNTAILAAVVYLLIALIFVFLYDRVAAKKIICWSLGLTLFVLLLFGLFYQPDYLYNGAYYHGTRYANEALYFREKEEYTPVFTKQSPYSFVSVVEAFGKSYLKINGRAEASTDEITQNLLAHLPLLFHGSPKAVAEIGYGGGYTLNVITMYPEVESIDTIEIDEVIIEAGKYIKDNGSPLSDPRVNLVIADGRNYLYGIDKKYDVITTETSHIWACPALFTKEFYELVKQRLNEGGIYSIWIPFYEMDIQDYAIMLNTIKSVFPHTVQFYLALGDVILLASEHEINIPEDIFRERLQVPAISQDFDLIKNITDEENLSNYEFINSHYFPNLEVERRIKEEVGEINIVNTDDRPILEFNTLRNKYLKFRKN